ncbi:MAG: hypothetical protein A4S09_14115 [Proteobacteria bacterium SG_bin7]|nr:MAG: hypothetical protein A4S09_14115 [Proteobacteria bacterium SG_bin7]
MDFEKYCSTAVCEYPRLCADLQKMTERVAAKIVGSSVTSVQKRLSLSAHDNNVLKTIGVVDVSDWKITTKKGSVTFIPDGLSIGVTGRIRIETKAKNPFFKGCIFTASTADESKWHLVTLDTSKEAKALTDEQLLEVLQSII